MPVPQATPTAITIGNFDGVHAGHAELVRLARAAAGESGQVVAMVFDPNPAVVLAPGREPARLSTFAQRARDLRALGVDEVVRLEPTQELLSRTPREFIEGVVRAHRPCALVEGPDFRFGAKRAGDLDTLRALGAEMGFETVVAEPIERPLSNQILVGVSSTMIRTLVEQGRVGDAGALLEKPYELDGVVVRGDQRGRTIGFPTANVRTTQLLPGDGVYAGTALVERAGEHRVYPAAIHVGPRPVFNKPERVVEAHLLGFDEPPGQEDADAGYGWPIRVRIERFLRDLAPFESVTALVAQIRRDVDRAAEVCPSHEEVCT
ncbi:MAG: riboflavin biosynthesis protein RibF [Planctomycetota bacterium]